MLSYLKTNNLLVHSFYKFIMPMVTVQGKTLTCENGANLRKVLLRHDINLHNGQSKIINCRGIGSCGTFAVEVTGAVSTPNWKDKIRRSEGYGSRNRSRLILSNKTVVSLAKQKF